MISTATREQGEKRSRTERPVLLIVPPFQGIAINALSVSQLKANLQHEGIAVEVLYLNLLYAERITPQALECLSTTGKSLVGEFIFAHVLHDRTDEHIRRYVDEVLAGTDLEPSFLSWFPGRSSFDALRFLIDEAAEFVKKEAIEAILSRDPWLVGFSSTFQANCCSLALSREIKRQQPDILTLIGGANCETEMGQELLAQYPDVDFIGRGECDNTLVRFVRALQAGDPGTELEGFLARNAESVMLPSPPLNSEALNALPHPDPSDYFEQLAQTSFSDQVEPGMTMETSRGCWWGEKHHCTFCGFNREGMAYRSKSPERAYEEMSALVEKHGVDRFLWTDNILDTKYLMTLLPELVKKPIADVFLETKSNLKREHLEMMARARIQWIQPGLESLSDKTLELMRKGTTQLQNVQTLKWSMELGIKIIWNWLHGFPGEDDGELAELRQTVRALHHLTPPGSSPVLYLERYSPYQTTPEEWGLDPIRPSPAYQHVYPFSDESLWRLAFFFDADFLEEKDKSQAHADLLNLAESWRTVHATSHFLKIPRRKSLVLIDTRPWAKRFVRRLTGLRRKIYEYCDRIHTESKIAKVFESEATPDEITAILRSFVDDLLMIHRKGSYLSLAVDPGMGYRQYLRVYPGGNVAPAAHDERAARFGRRLGRRVADLVALRIPPGRILRSLRGRLRNLAMRQLVAFLSRPQPSPPGPLEPQPRPAEG